MQGNLKQIQLPEVLQFISMGKSTGLLNVKDGTGTETTLMIRSGRIINSSALERQRRLGDLLVHRGILKRSTLAQVLTLQRTIESDKRLGQILVERDIIHENQIREVLRLQLEEEIWNLFGIEEGEFKFEQVSDEKLGETSVQIEIEPLLLEGTRRQDEWRKIVRIIPNDRLVPKIKGLPQTEEEKKKFQFSPQEWRILAQVNGRCTVQAIVNRAGLGRFEVYQVISMLVLRGVLQVLPERLEEDSAEAASTRPTGSTLAPAKSAVGGILSLFGAGGKREEKADKIACVSPLGILTVAANRYAEALLGAREWKAAPSDQGLVRRMWADLLVSYWRADLIVCEKGQLNCQRMEDFIRFLEFKESTQDCYEDSLEALVQFINGLYRLASQRIGEKVAARIAREVIDETAARTTTQYATDFRLAERLQIVLRLAN